MLLCQHQLNNITKEIVKRVAGDTLDLTFQLQSVTVV